MAILLILVAAGAAVVSEGSDLFVFAIVNAVLSFWGNGVLANFGPREVDAAPNWAAVVSFVTTIAAIGFYIAAAV